MLFFTIKKSRILILINKDVIGGAEVQALNFFNWCKCNNINTYLFFLEKGFKKNFFLNNSFINYILQIYRVFYIVNKYKPSVIDAHLSRSCYIASILKLFYPHIILVLNNHTNVYEYYSKKGITGKINIFLTRILFPLADLIICVSEYCKRDFSSINKCTQKIFVVPNSFYFNYDLIYENPFSNNESNVFNVIFVGRLVIEKNVDIIISSFRFLPNNFKLYVIGDGPQYTNLSNIIVNLNLSDRVKLIGSSNCVGKWYQHSNLCVLASESESFGNVVIESFSYGTPVLCFQGSGGPSEILSSFDSYFCYPLNNPHVIAKYIKFIEEFSKKNIVDSQNFINYSKNYCVSKICPKKLTLILNLYSLNFS